MVVLALKEHNPFARISFYNWFVQSVGDGEVDPQLVLFFHWGLVFLHGAVSSQDNQY
jgi:hypothetical protein